MLLFILVVVCCLFECKWLCTDFFYFAK